MTSISSSCLQAFVWGLTMGFSHCVGMCGIFVIACAPQSGPERNTLLSSLKPQTLFQAGRIVSLSLLGLVGGAIGSLAGFAARYGTAQGWVAVLAGSILILLAIGQVGIVPALRMPEPDIMNAGSGSFRAFYIRALKSKKPYKPLIMGILVGLLPCGLTYTFLLVAAATMSPFKGLEVMVSFALGTIPGLLTLGVSAGVLTGFFSNLRFRLWMTRAGGAILFLIGVLMIVRGVPYLQR